MPLAGKTQSGLLRSPLLGGPIMAGAPAGLLLDDYPSALVAYSFRKLRTLYAGSAVRIRRSSDNGEIDVGFSGEDFDAAAAATHIGGGNGFIVTWYDQSGNADNMAQASAGEQPQYVASGIGSLPVLTFLGTGNLINASISLGGNLLSASAVATMTTSPNSNARLISMKSGGAGNDYDTDLSAIVLARSGGNQEIASVRESVTTAKAITYDVPAVFSAIWDNTNQKTYVDGGTPTSSAQAGTFGSTQTVRIGAEVAATANWFGQAGEIVMWASDETSDIAAIVANQAAYWSI